ncbi:Multicopper oxidase [hydrothermal vent metagenome]|uniref:Multicopper oxidase n=1 Tax=hydrothermal vent metagenome TaxID=652676 RepID=A0A3B1CVE6_9ZZZZ
MNRRKFITNSVLTTGVILTPSLLQSCTNDTNVPVSKRDPKFKPDIELNLTSKFGSVPILPGKPTDVFNFEASLINGDPSNLQTIPDSYLGPIIRIRNGQKIRINYKNMLDQESIVHWHGLHVPEEMDGHPRFVIDEGEEYIYEFEVDNRAGTYWFHPHPHGKTGPQVYFGLAGLFIVTDKEEEALDLPKGEYDIPLIIQDRTFDSDNQLVYIQNPMERMNGFLGKQVIINGKPDFNFPVSSKAYRFRLLNGSNSRIYKLAWSNGMPLTVIGNDGGLLEKPVTKEYVVLGPAERLDIIADFSGMKLNSKVELISLPFPNPNSGGGMMMGRMGGSSGLPNGTKFKLAEFNILKIVNEQFSLPDKLSNIQSLNISSAININDPRSFTFAMSHMNWTINGRTFGMTDVASDEKVKLNTTEVWEFINGSSGRGRMGGMGGMMQMPHPVHIHQLQFRIIERNIGQSSSLWQSLKDGFLDEGWKDTFLLLPGMKVKILISFKDYPGLFLYHCHNLEHEDMGMMRNYLIST